MSKSNLYFLKKLVPTQILIENLITSSELRAIAKFNVIKGLDTLLKISEGPNALYSV